MKKIAIGIDFSKKTFDVTVVRRDGYSFKELDYKAFTNDFNGFMTFEKWVKATIRSTPEAKEKSAWLFCGEHTGTYSIPLCDYLAKKGYFMWLESALIIHRKCGIVREKNDRIDSRRIAEYALRNFSDEVKPYTLDNEDMKKLKSLYAAHAILTKDKVAKQNQLKSGVFDDSDLALDIIEAQVEAIRKEISRIDAEIKKLLTTSEEFSHNFDILQTFKGVGMVSIACIIIKTRNFNDMTDSRELGCYIGVVPHGQQSGTSVDKKPRTSRYRDREANGLLTNCVMSAIRYNNPIIRPYYDRLIARGVIRPKALNNCKFKIINVLLAMIRNGEKFDINKHNKSKAEWSKSA